VAGRVYSERFIATDSPSAWVYYGVPQGKRAVSRCVTATSSASATNYVEVLVDGIYLFFFTFQAAGSQVHGDLRVPAYAGQLITVHHVGQGLWSTVSGYLFNDDGSAAADVGAQAELETPPSDHVCIGGQLLAQR
jgi:hypothetical protein